MMVANSVDWWCSRLPDEGAEEIYASGPDAIIATAFQPPVEGAPVDGGYRLSGQRPLASNAQDADWLMLTAKVPGDDGESAGRYAHESCDIWAGGAFLAAAGGDARVR